MDLKLNMVSATFIFRKKQYDEEFYRLDSEIEGANRLNSEYLGKDSWENTAEGLHCVVYYYASLQGLEGLRQIASHKVAKNQYSRWYEGYHVVVSEVLRSYGDGTIDHPTPALES